MAKTIGLINAVETAAEYNLRKNPPTKEQISMLEPEDYAKLKADSEYFWVKVDQVINRPSYVGIVTQDPTFPQKFQKGDKINFDEINVFDIRSREWMTNEGI